MCSLCIVSCDVGLEGFEPTTFRFLPLYVTIAKQVVIGQMPNNYIFDLHNLGFSTFLSVVVWTVSLPYWNSCKNHPIYCGRVSLFQLRYLPFSLYTIMRITMRCSYVISCSFSFSLGIVLQHYWLVGSVHLLWGFPPNLGDSNKDFRALSHNFLWVCCSYLLS